MLAEHTTGEPCAYAADCTRDAMCRGWVQRTMPRSLCKPDTQLRGRAPRPQTARGARCVAAGCNAPRCAACAKQKHATGGLRVLVANCTRDAVCREHTTKQQQTSPHTQSDTHKPCRLQGGVPWEPCVSLVGRPHHITHKHVPSQNVRTGNECMRRVAPFVVTLRSTVAKSERLYLNSVATATWA